MKRLRVGIRLLRWKSWGRRSETNGQGTVIKVDFQGTLITDAGLVHLKGLTKLQSLDLNGTRVTDTGLVHLTSITSLATKQIRQMGVLSLGRRCTG